MYSAASNALQTQVLLPLSCWASQSSAGAMAGSRTARGHPVSMIQKKLLNENTAGVTSCSDMKALNSHQDITAISSKEQLVKQNPNVASIISSHSAVLPLKDKSPDNEQNINVNLISQNVKTCVSINESGHETHKLVISSKTQTSYESAINVNELVKDYLGYANSKRVMTLYGTCLKNHTFLNKCRKILTSESLTASIKDVIMQKSSQTRVNPWHVSYVSACSFMDNKHPVKPATTKQQQGNCLHLLLPRIQSGSGVSLPHIQVQGFKTLRTLEQDSLRQVTMRSRLRGKVLPPIDSAATAQSAAESSTKLKTLVNEEAAEGGQQQLKLAFAEGYLAAEGSAQDKKKTSRAMRWLRNFQQLLAIVVLLVVLASVMSTMGGSLFRINVTNGNEVQPEEITVSFDDVRGVEEAKQELEEIVEFLKCPEKFTSLGAELPKGVLLVGPPGTGKTLLARAVAGEAGVPFFHAAGPEFDEILVGQGARRVRDLFRAAKVRAPCVIFIDEIDSVGAKRTNSVLHPYANQTINQLLAEMDGFHKNEGVIVLGATNRRDDLDKALLRPGRFDVEVQVPIPDLAGRREIFQYYLGKVKTGHDVEVEVLSRGTTGFTGADIKNVVNQAALRAAADLVDAVSMKHLESARDKVLMGPEKKSRIPDEEVNLVTAYHEGGHTLVAHYTPHCHPLHKVTIIPRGPSLGHTAYIPAKEQYNVTRAQMLASLDSLMGGRAAEELVFGAEMITSGASSDLKQATSMATHMVKDFGMSERVGLRTFEDTSGQLLGGGDTLSTTTKEAIDAEIKRLLQESYERARSILRTHSKEHKALAEALLKYETLDADDIKAILDGRSVTKET